MRFNWFKHKSGRRPSDAPWWHGLQESLGKSNRQIENVYTRLGEQFVPLAQKVGELGKARAALAELAQNRDGERLVIEETSARLEPPLAHLLTMVERQDEVSALLSRCEEQTVTLLRYQHDIDQILSPLTYVETLIKIEATTLIEEDRATFFAVAAEIARLRKLVDEKFRDNTASLESTRQALSQLHRSYIDGFKKKAVQIREGRKRTKVALQRLDKDLRQNSELDQRTHSLTESLCSKILAIISSLQTQDIVKQQTEHVQIALRNLDPKSASRPSLPTLLRGHLELALKTVRQGHEGLAQNLDTLSGELDELDHHTLHQDGFDSRMAAVDGMVQGLLDALDEVEGMIDATNTLVEESRNSAAPAAHVVGKVNLALGELSTNMRLIALNAQVRSAQITEGTGLGTLAAHTAEISRKITSFGQHIGDEVERLQAATRELMDLFERFGEDGTRILRELTDHSGPAKQRLHGIRDQVLRFSHLFGEIIDLVRQASREAIPVAASLPNASAGISDALVALGQAFPKLRDGQASKALSKREKSALESHADHYSMASEREVHGEVTGSRQAQSSAEIELF